ncbi:MAG TPA: tetratricopeptide repeat protein [Thiotrichaceae bacterium]|nr:tetratricopeptide repeat protein [Thiotrichaceae bacterium]
MPTQRLYCNQLSLALLIFSFSQALMASQDCDLATDLVFRAYHLHSQGRAISQQKLLFSKSLQLCPNRPDVHTTLASLLYKQGQYSEAVHHYKQALRYDKKFYKAWHGLGETYYKQKRFPLSLEAHLQACSALTDSKTRVMALLKNKRYAFTGKEELIERESLLVLYDEQRRQHLNKKISDCKLYDMEVFPKHIFINLRFGLNEANLPPSSEGQLDEIAAALQKLDSSIITIHGHSDSQQFWYVKSLKRRKQLNQELSFERATNIVAALVYRGISEKSFEIQGHGDKLPLRLPLLDASVLAFQRRVEIEVMPVITQE